MSDFEPCGLGVCSAEEGHLGTCRQASGWDDGGWLTVEADTDRPGWRRVRFYEPSTAWRGLTQRGFLAVAS